MKTLELIKEYPGWPWLLAPSRPLTGEVIRPAVVCGTATSPVQVPAQSVTGRPVDGGKVAGAIDWELAVRAKP